MIRRSLGLLTLLFALSGCPGRQDVSTTKGSIVIECDEAILPVMQRQADDFQRSYPEARIILRPVGGRVATVDFINDSVKVIALSRSLNLEEREALTSSGAEYRDYHVALDAVAVILYRQPPMGQFRIGQLDSIFSGVTTRWPVRNGRSNPIMIALNGINSSTNEIFRSTILQGKPFAEWASYSESSSEVIEFVSKNQDAIGIVGLSWLKGTGERVSVAAVGDPLWQPDSTQPVGHFYSPAQANVYRHYYRVTTPVFMYNREILRTVGLGFIAYVTSLPGQKVFQENGLVPATMPVRLIETTSTRVN